MSDFRRVHFTPADARGKDEKAFFLFLGAFALIEPIEDKALMGILKKSPPDFAGFGQDGRSFAVEMGPSSLQSLIAGILKPRETTASFVFNEWNERFAESCRDWL